MFPHSYLTKTYRAVCIKTFKPTHPFACGTFKLFKIYRYRIETVSRILPNRKIAITRESGVYSWITIEEFDNHFVEVE